MADNSWQKLGLTCAVFVALVGMALLAGHIPAIQAIYMQVSGALLSLLGIHHGHDLVSQKLSASDDDETPAAPVAPPVPAAPLVTAQQLLAIMPHAGGERCALNVPAICAAAQKWEINNPARLAMWLGNCALECNELREMQEEWKPTEEQLQYEPPHHVAKILGNTQPGDGKRFLGRGVVQLTGRSNYQQAGRAIGRNLVQSPAQAAEIDTAWDIAGWFWQTRGLNEVADSGDFQETVQRINGGLTDLALRQGYYERARAVLAPRA